MASEKTCTHCGKPAAGDYSLVFDRQTETREMTLALCENCIDVLIDGPDVRRPE